MLGMGTSLREREVDCTGWKIDGYDLSVCPLFVSCAGGLAPRHGSEPFSESCRADLRVLARGERLIVHRYAEVACVRICDYLAWIMGCSQESSDEFVKRYPFGTGYLDRAVHRRPDCDVSDGGSHVIGPDGLRKSGRQVDRLFDGAELGDGAHDFVELRCLDARVR